MKSRQKRLEFWQEHIVRLSKSGLSPRAYCQENGLKVSTFNYWRSKMKAPTPGCPQGSVSDNRWVTLQVADDPPCDSGIRLRIGRVTIEVEPGFNRELLGELLKIAGAAC